MVTVEGLTKWYGSQCAVDHISFTARPGEILGFLGPNGAGKSTTMKMVTAYLPQDAGKVTVSGFDTQLYAHETKSRIGYLPEHNPLYKDMYVREFLHFAAGIHRLPKTTSRINDIIEMTGLGKEQHKVIDALSKGYRQRVGLAQAMLHDPEVLILDEPTSGLDMNQLADIRSLIRELGRTKTVILSTHIMQEVQALCDRVVIINEGKLVADDPIGELQNRIKGENLVKVNFLETGFDTARIEKIKGVRKVEAKGISINIYSDAAYDVRPDVFRLCAAEHWVILEMNQEKLSVEYIFQKLTKHTHDA
ncbi:MAG: ATP-binding cassette domain-containing protein [Saprospiraceae bacterium]|nr:ATP-binding cassette domain-containing protein [Saprospiraceae bacterium]